MDFSSAALSSAGFVGWAKLASFDTSAVPTTNGVYVALLPTDAGSEFLNRNNAFRHKGRDPTVSIECLEANWVSDAEVVYIGKADNLRQRLREFQGFGLAKPKAHWGGRLVWQLSAADQLTIAWLETPGRVAAAVEREMLTAFRSAHGKPPFANAPHLWGR